MTVRLALRLRRADGTIQHVVRDVRATAARPVGARARR
jgi:hypothetical protein